jgi:hypothetical protein
MAVPSPSREEALVPSTSLRGSVAGRMCGSSAICKGSHSQHGGRGRPGSSNRETLSDRALSPRKRRISPLKVGPLARSVACPPARQCRTGRTRVDNQLRGSWNIEFVLTFNPKSVSLPHGPRLKHGCGCARRSERQAV